MEFINPYVTFLQMRKIDLLEETESNWQYSGLALDGLKSNCPPCTAVFLGFVGSVHTIFYVCRRCHSWAQLRSKH